MPLKPRTMRLSDRHVAYLQPTEISEDTIAQLLAQMDDPGEIWFFAYGSLIWKPACDFVEMRTGTIRGWHRAFCLG